MISKYILPLFLITLGLLAFGREVAIIDPDFGWHFRLGELIIREGIPKTDPFSYSMPSYPFVDHEWLTNVLFYSLHINFGMLILSVIFSLLFISSLIIVVPKKLINFSLIPILLAGSAMVSFTLIRPQIITWFFLAVLLRIVLDSNLWKKWKYLLPLIFIPWVNLHGGFAVGIAVLFVLFVSKTVENRRFEKENIVIFCSSLLFTLFNPHGIRIWWEVFMQISDTSLHWKISEWLPGVFFMDLAFLLLIALAGFFISKYRSEFNLAEKSLFIFFSLMAFSSVRHIPLWSLFSIYIMTKSIFLFHSEVKKNKFNLLRFKQAEKVLIIVFLGVFACVGVKNLIDIPNSAEKKTYPLKAVEFLNRQKIEGEVFSTYNWGGYLIWKLPQKKVFIDGRMPSWRRVGDYPGESNNAFKDWTKALESKKSFKKAILKYNIEYVLLPKTIIKKETGVSASIEKIRKQIFSQKPSTPVTEKDLVSLGLKKVYDDGLVIVYKE